MSIYHLETVEDVDRALAIKSAQVHDIVVPGQRRMIAEQVDLLLDMRLALGQLTVGSCECGDAA